MGRTRSTLYANAARDLENAGWPDVAIAEVLRIDERTVRRYRERRAQSAIDAIEKSMIAHAALDLDEVAM
jgi:hypothetical protein